MEEKTMKAKFVKTLCLLLLLFSVIALSACSDKPSGGTGGGSSDAPDAPTCTVTFDSDGGTSVPSQTVKKGEKATAPENPTKEGFVFDGWYYGEEKWSFVGYVVTEDMTVRAKWIEGVKVSFVDSDGNTIFPPRYVIPGSKVENPGMPEGYVSEKFLGWYSEGERWIFDDVISGDLTLVAMSIADGYDWPKNTEIVVQISMNYASDEISSGGKSYYSGENMQMQQSVQSEVRKRNEKAEDAIGVDVKYLYSGEVGSYGYKEIATDVFSKSANAPDIMISSANNIAAATVRKCFENLLSTDPEIYPKGNHFSFVRENYDPTVTDYFDKNSGDGYLYSYMESLSLTPETKLYSVVSNYTLDAIRSFYVIPVNVNLMSLITDAEVAPAGDRDGDGDHDINDFYELVYDGDYGWDYEALAGYAVLARSNTNLLVPECDIMDDRVGFALSFDSWSHTGAAILYSSKLDILTKDFAGYRYPYNGSGKLGAVVNSFRTFLSENDDSVCTVTTAECQSLDLSAKGKSAMAYIRDKFAGDGVLFGGITCLGNLEEEAYQNLRVEGFASGFGFVPVPLYQDHSIAGEKYLTPIHTTARIAAISRESTEKSECSAFLDYQSRNSAEILEEYCENFLATSAGALEADANARMVYYMRNHASSGFDMYIDELVAYERAEISILDKPHNKRWKIVLVTTVDAFEQLYLASYPDKEAALYQIQSDWERLGTSN